MLDNVLALAVATAVLVLVPGPNVALIVANSLCHGLRNGLVTVVGTTTGVALQLALVVIGMAAVIEFAADMLAWIRWAGVAYLVYIGIRTWREPRDDLHASDPAPAMFWRGFALAAINPKTLMFSAAFLPQFLPATPNSPASILVLAAVFLCVLAAGDTLWALGANRARALLRRYAHLHNKLSGGFLVAAGVGLAAARRQG